MFRSDTMKIFNMKSQNKTKKGIRAGRALAGILSVFLLAVKILVCLADKFRNGHNLAVTHRIPNADRQCVGCHGLGIGGIQIIVNCLAHFLNFIFRANYCFTVNYISDLIQSKRISFNF